MIGLFFKTLLAAALFGLTGAVAIATTFQDFTAGYGTTTTIAGVRQSETKDGSGNAINFWVPAFEGALASSVTLSNPHIAAADAFGNIYIADKASHSVLKVTTDGRIHTFAGTHMEGNNGDGPALATTLHLDGPNGLYVLPNGVVYILDPGNHRIRRVDTSGIMTTVVNDRDPNWHSSGRALWVSNDEQLIYYTHEYIFAPSTTTDGATVKKWTPFGGIEIVCSRAVGFSNPGNIAVNPIDGKLYVTDRAEDDSANKLKTGLWRIDGPEQRTRMTGNISQFPAADGRLAIASFIDGVRGVAFLADGSYFLCAHTEGSIWYVDTAGVLHKYLQGKGTKDTYSLPNGQHPPLVGNDYFSQPRAVTIAPNGTLIGVSNDSGFVFAVNNILPKTLPTNLTAARRDANGLKLNWSAGLTQSYLVERSLQLQAPQWEIIGAVGGAGALTEFTDADAITFPRAYYRLSPPR
ncbi:MAG: hypothetical protein JWL59_2411 [Chthoniobacteraceae bacterium]|nr:hypothetical protein [Chthoniobacteraceae bacterium]